MAGNTTRRATAGRRALALVLLALLGAAPVLAQGWTWPWEQDNRPPPRPSAPVYQDQPRFGPPPQQVPGGGNICLQLEQRLAMEANRGGGQVRSNLGEIEQGIRQAAQNIRAGEAQLERSECYEYFLFSKSLRRSRQCITLHNQVQDAKRALAGLEDRRNQFASSNSRSYRDDIVRELARNNCGESYVREARKFSNPFSSIWQDESSESMGGGGNRFNELPFATYRTVCVRLCDGYYFPVSFSTLPNHFDRDAEVCQSKCAAPSELYYHQNPGEGIDQAVSYTSKQPYSSLRTAFRYRKEFIQGCSCKSAEYVPADQIGQPAKRRADTPAPSPASQRRN